MDGPFGKAQRRRPNPALTAAAVCARAVCTVLALQYYVLLKKNSISTAFRAKTQCPLPTLKKGQKSALLRSFWTSPIHQRKGENPAHHPQLKLGNRLAGLL